MKIFFVKWRILMSIYDQVVSNGVKLDTVATQLTAIAAQIAAIQPGTGTATDLTPVLTAVAAVQTSVNAVIADITPAAPAA